MAFTAGADGARTAPDRATLEAWRSRSWSWPTAPTLSPPLRASGLACRMYRTVSGLSGAPDVEQLRRALASAARVDG